MDKEPTDEELVARCVASDDDQAFRCLLDRHIEKVTRVAASILGVRMAFEVDDVVQEVFVRVHRGLKTFRSESKFSTWIFRITYNQSITHKQRGLARLARREQDDASEAVSREVAPHRSLEIASLRASLDRAIDRLPAEYQLVIRQYYWFDVPLADIATQFDAPENTIKSWLHRARKLLAYSLDQEEHSL